MINLSSIFTANNNWLKLHQIVKQFNTSNQSFNLCFCWVANRDGGHQIGSTIEEKICISEWLPTKHC